MINVSSTVNDHVKAGNNGNKTNNNSNKNLKMKKRKKKKERTVRITSTARFLNHGLVPSLLMKIFEVLWTSKSWIRTILLAILRLRCGGHLLFPPQPTQTMPNKVVNKKGSDLTYLAGNTSSSEALKL